MKISESSAASILNVQAIAAPCEELHYVTHSTAAVKLFVKCALQPSHTSQLGAGREALGRSVPGRHVTALASRRQTILPWVVCGDGETCSRIITVRPGDGAPHFNPRDRSCVRQAAPLRFSRRPISFSVAASSQARYLAALPFKFLSASHLKSAAATSAAFKFLTPWQLICEAGLCRLAA